MNIKKQYNDIHTFLVANQNKKVSTILEEIEMMMESKTKDTTSLYDVDGNVVAIFCYYHKVWELVNDIEYGSKVNTKTGLNTMCKKGVSRWNKQQSTLKNIKSDILQDVAVGTVKPEEINALEAKLFAEAREIQQEIDVEVFTTEEALTERVGHKLYIRQS